MTMGWLLDGYDGVLLDLDGTAYRGALPLPGAVDVVRELRYLRRSICYVTNNAARSAAEVATQLAGMGFEASATHVVTSSEAAAAMLAERLRPGSRVLVVGTDALAEAIRAAGLEPVRAADAGPVAVVQGHSPHTGWSDLAEGCIAIRAGALWVACNVDPTLPTERGQLPGNGAMVAALRAATGGEPLVAGKPTRRLLDLAAARIDSSRPLVVGDRLDSDIAGARAAGLDSMLVLTGVTDPAGLLAAPRGARPTFVAADLGGLRRPAEVSRVAERPRWHVRVNASQLELTSTGGDEPVDALIALCAARWPVGAGPAQVTAADDTAAAALASLGLG